MKTLAIVSLAAAGLLAVSSANAQAYIGYMPAAPVVAYYQAPIVPYGPVLAAPVAGPVVSTAYYAPAPYFVAQPVAVPYYVAQPVVAPAVVPAVAPVYGRAVVVRPKVYVVGQPVRNVLRAVTP
jgi:hypothetical protein